MQEQPLIILTPTDEARAKMDTYPYGNLDIDSQVYRGREDPKRTHTGRESGKIRSHRSVLVCLVVLCIFLLTAAIVLCVLINANNHLTEERDDLRVKYNNITKLAEQLNREKTDLWTHLYDGWIYSQFSLYFISSELKNWTESRRYCRERGADLTIINNKEEQDLLQKMCGADKIWIGLSDTHVEGRWKWVDGSTLTISFWKPGQPNSYGGNEDCAETHSTGWNDCSCYEARKWVCEKHI